MIFVMNFNELLNCFVEGLEEEEEEVIRCVCGIFRDEGLMIQCEKCFVSNRKCLVFLFLDIGFVQMLRIGCKDSNYEAL